MDNAVIADYFSLYAKLLDIHGENSFKSKSYAAAAFAIEKLPTPLASLPAETIAGIKGIGKSTAEKVSEILTTGRFLALEQLIQNTPSGVIEMLAIKGIGPKKIHIIWKEMGIESVGELLYACKENRLKLYKGFGEKTQDAIIAAVEFMMRNKGKFLYAQINEILPVIEDFLKENFGSDHVHVTGDYARQLEIISSLDFIIVGERSQIQTTMKEVGFELMADDKEYLPFQAKSGVEVRLYPVSANQVAYQHLKLTSAPEVFQFLDEALKGETLFQSEEELFTKAGISLIPEYLRESVSIVKKYKTDANIIQHGDIKGIIHSHSNWSDGGYTIEEMAKACIERGMEYLVISDHSVSAFYANGLSVERIKEQHLYIDELNRQLAPFKIYKSIESDILNDGRLDYSDEVLSSFDLVIASVHSNLRMSEEKAMQRLLTAIQNPYTTILGHPTGRLLLSRNGYPLDMQQIIEACIEHEVVIELNANPNRLDIDWRWIDYAVEKGALISINPDAHSLDGIDDILFGVKVAQKAALLVSKNLSSFTRDEFEAFLAKRSLR